MSKKTPAILAFIVLASLSLLLLSCASSSSRPSDVLYVLSQGSNNVGSYALDISSGNLSLINSNASTCATLSKTPSVSCGFPIDIFLDPSGSVAYVLDQGDSTNNPPVVPAIYTYSVNSDGSLGTGTDATTALNAFTPGDTAVAMTRDTAGKFLFVVTQGNQISQPTLAPQLIVFSIQSGTLSVASTLTLTRIPTPGEYSGAVVAAITFGTPAQTLLYIANDKDLVGTNDNTVSEFSIDSTGNATELSGNGYSPYTTDRVPSAVVAVSPAPNAQTSSAVFVFVANSTGNDLNVFQVCTVANGVCSTQDVANFKLNPVGSLVTVAAEPVAMVVDPTSNFLYVVSRTGNEVAGFRISQTAGTLSSLNPATLSTGLNPIAVAMHKSGSFLFISNYGGSTISAYNLDTTSGAMSTPRNVTSEAQPAGLVSR